MLTKLTLSNFRGFDDEVTVNFRPITVLIGHNNAGKSSIIKFLLMLQQSLTVGMPQFLTPEGNKVQLGIFSQLKNSLTDQRNLKFELVAGLSFTPAYALLRYMENQNIDNVKIYDGKLLAKVGADISYGGQAQKGTAKHSLIDGNSGKSILEHASKVSDDSVFLHMGSKSMRILNAEMVETEKSTQKSEDLSLKEIRKSIDEIKNTIESIFRAQAESSLMDVLRYEIESIHHLSSVREESQRVILAAPPPMTAVGQKGQYAIPHLYKLVTHNKDKYDFVRYHLEKIAGISEIQFKKASGYMHRCVAKNQKTGAEMLIANYGFGVSQCLPVFVQGAIMDPRTFLMVEQPEAHLHPTAQLDMGEFFCDLWREYGVGSIIETHSDNVLLRLRRLVAKGKISPAEISVAYFTHKNKNGRAMPTIKNLDIKEDGSVKEDDSTKSGLPMDFFGANILEGLKLGAGR